MRCSIKHHNKPKTQGSPDNKVKDLQIVFQVKEHHNHDQQNIANPIHQYRG